VRHLYLHTSQWFSPRYLSPSSSNKHADSDVPFCFYHVCILFISVETTYTIILLLTWISSMVCISGVLPSSNSFQPHLAWRVTDDALLTVAGGDCGQTLGRRSTANRQSLPTFGDVEVGFDIYVFGCKFCMSWGKGMIVVAFNSFALDVGPAPGDLLWWRRAKIHLLSDSAVYFRLSAPVGCHYSDSFTAHGLKLLFYLLLPLSLSFSFLSCPSTPLLIPHATRTDLLLLSIDAPILCQLS